MKQTKEKNKKIKLLFSLVWEKRKKYHNWKNDTCIYSPLKKWHDKY